MEQRLFFYVQIEKMGSEKSVIRDIIIVTNSMKLVRRKLKILFRLEHVAIDEIIE